MKIAFDLPSADEAMALAQLPSGSRTTTPCASRTATTAAASGMRCWRVCWLCSAVSPKAASRRDDIGPGIFWCPAFSSTRLSATHSRR